MKLTKTLALATIGLSLTGCASINNFLDINTQESTNKVADQALLNRAPEANDDPHTRSGDYYTSMGKATLPENCPASGYSYTGRIDSTGRIGAACGVITADTVAKLKGHSENWPTAATPLGLKTTKNEKVSIEKRDGSSYNGYFYNKSHLIADSLGGDWTYENNIAGTRTQNVGEGSGGMRYPEIKTTEYVTSHPSCPVTYSAEPLYQGDEIVPRAVEVNMKSCDGELNEKVITYNDAYGYTIDYSTGAFTKN